MCGIVGMMALEGSTLEGARHLPRMRDVMAHRGPDGAGIWLSPDDRVALGHRRLSILDLSESAAQPMSNEDGTVWISFNGEIYNHAEIRAELETGGRHRWTSHHSDTEVIIHAFEEWGIDCLHRFRGMFAFALWDGRCRRLWLVRDRLGIKPLYYSFRPSRLTFASEIKALLQDPDQRRRFDPEALYHYLSFLTAPAPQTLFDGIHKLPAGTWLCIEESGRVEVGRWWDAWDHVTPLDRSSEEEIAERLLSELRCAVRLRKVSDVAVGVFLSGGIDSSTNAALFSEGESHPVQTFSIGYAGEYASYRNELDFARMMAGRVGANHHERLLKMDDLLDFLPEMVRLQDEPIADPVCVPVYYVSKLARDHGVVVCQVGEGADELFFGYPWWKQILQLYRLNALPVPRLMKQAGLVGLRAAGRSRTNSYELLRRGTSGQPLFWGGAEAFSETQKQRLLGPALRQRLAGLTSWDALRPIRRRFEEKAWEPSHFHWMTYLDLNLRLPELLLMRIDKMSMAVALEGRVPFLDHKVVELALGIPTAVKTRHGQLKYILKKAVRSLVPTEILNRPKQGFGVPVHEWFFDRLGETARTELRAFCRKTELFHWPEVKRLFEKGRCHHLWCLLNVALWHKEYME